jgi:WD40 repeat protein
MAGGRENQVIVYYASFSPDGSRVLSTTSTGRGFGLVNDIPARVWDAATGQLLATLKTSEQMPTCESAVFSPNSRHVLVAGGFVACIWNPDSDARQILKGHNQPVGSAFFSPDGKRVVTGSHDRTARIWDVASGRELTVLKGHEGPVTFVRWSPDGKWIVTVGRDRTARIWDAATGQEIVTLRRQEQEFHAATFSNDGRQVLAESWADARLWPLDLLEAARQRRPRDPTPAECERFEIGP